jgi:hypothetical protein
MMLIMDSNALLGERDRLRGPFLTGKVKVGTSI